MAGAGAVAAGGLLAIPRVVRAQASNPLPPNLMQEIGGAAEELYIQAYIRDPSNTVANGGSYGGPMPGLDQVTIGNLATYCQQLNAFASSQGVYRQNFASIPVASISPTYLTFAGNQAQLSLKKDFFTQVTIQQAASQMGLALPYSAPSGAVLQQTMAGVIGDLQQVANGNYARLHIRRKGILVYASDSGMSNGEAFIGGATLAGSGGVLLSAAGGPAVLTAPITSAAAAAVIGWTGFGMIIVGGTICIYRLPLFQPESRRQWPVAVSRSKPW